MGNIRRRSLMRSSALAGALSLAVVSAAVAADQKIVAFDMPEQSLGESLRDFYRASGEQIVFSENLVAGRRAPVVRGDYTPDQALAMLLDGTNLTARRSATGVVMIEAPQSGSAAGDGAEGTVDTLVVTAQKREEDIQDVPIAISAFTQEALERSQIAGGPDLMTQIPNMTFTKTNFTSYSIQIRGIGTQAISATTDPGVAVAFNNTPFIRNRFFEQEFYDLQRVEVLRGPQGTLYGRNATAGVVNIISAKPSFGYEAKLSGDVANYNSTRLEGMINIPLVEDVAALRIAGAWTKRDGYATNEITGNPIDGRDLWSTRVSLRFAPTDRLDANLIWEHFEEDDDRLRSGKQVCNTDDRNTIHGYLSRVEDLYYAEAFSQGCIPASMYAPESYRAPDGFSLPYYHATRLIGLPTVPGFNPYLSTIQSRDLRVIESTIDPEYRAKTDLVELQLNFDLTDNLTLTSETAYGADEIFSMQDFNRFNTAPGAFDPEAFGVVASNVLDENGTFCDPQIGCADRLVLMDLSTAESRQFSQEIRIGSDFEGPFNFSLGANYLRYDTEDKYYVFINTISLIAAIRTVETGGDYMPGVTDGSSCMPEFPKLPDADGFERVSGCLYMDPNPIHSLNDQGHNYFLSKNPYKLISYALFGEGYYNITPDLKLTAGLRMTVDKKDAPRIPSWLLATNTVGYSVAEVIKQEWTKPTGRVALDWKPDLGFTDETLLYASYARGYKAGGANPPAAGVVTWQDNYGALLAGDSVTQPKTFDAEFVDAFEIGAKNTLLDGKLTLNLGAFYYDYKDYQISYIVNRSAVNLNFDAEVWGAEIEADWRPTDNLRFGFKGGYENTRVADGERAIDTMDRTAGRTDWVVMRPFPSYPSNCIVPLYTVVTSYQTHIGNEINQVTRLGFPPNVYANGHGGPCEFAYLFGVDPVTGVEYVPNPRFGSPGWPAWEWFNGPLTNYFPDYAGWDPTLDYGNNNGEGFFKPLGGKELPNAPHFTATITADYTIPLPNEWLATLHTDLYYQSESWARIFNTEGYDKLKAYTNVNLAAIFTNEDAGWKVMAYVKNVFDKDAITGAFLLSDDTALVTNVFLNEPRLYGLRVTKEWGSGGFGWLGEGRERKPGTPSRFLVEVGGGVSRLDGDVEDYRPAWPSPALSGPLEVQDDDLDWGDIRDIKLTYAFQDGWKASAAYRVGRTNGEGSGYVLEETPDGQFYDLVSSRDNHARVGSRDGEEFVTADFVVGKEMGLGAWGEGGKSTLSAGLRYASFQSDSRIDVDGSSEGHVDPVITSKYGETRWNANWTSLESTREFEGVGPTLSWESAVRLAGDDVTGHADLEWRVGGGVLFGKQTTESVEERYTLHHYSEGIKYSGEEILDDVVVPRRRTDEVTVPNLTLDLGVSYTVDRVKVSTGYAYDRFFDAIDAGWRDAKREDRTIQGPYLKLSLGFGG